MEIYSLQQTKLQFTWQEQDISVFPVLVESCMHPDTYRLYPVHIEVNRALSSVHIHSLQGEWTISYDKIPITSSNFIPKKPQRKGCDGNCDVCRKCC